jgi:hypothetical protein
MPTMKYRDSSATFLAQCAPLALLCVLPSCSAFKEAAVDAKESRIADECRLLPADSTISPDHWAREWAGEYYVGDGTGMNVHVQIAPKSGIVYTWHGCMGLYDSGRGSVQSTFDEDGDGRTDGVIVKWDEAPSSTYGFNSQKWYFVRWPGPNGTAGRRYFVPEDQMMHLVDNYDEGGFARDGLYSAPRKFDRAGGERPRWGGGGAAVEGAPQLTEKWAKLLITVPFDAHVVRAVPAGSHNVTRGVDVTRARLILDKGRADGLHLGMKIRIGGWSTDSGSLTIERLEEHEAEGKFEVFTSAREPAALPAVGEAIRIGQAEELLGKKE